jgi:hypothetical protein
MARARGTRRRRNAAEAQAVNRYWKPGDVDNSWMKYSRCRVCNRKVAINNNPEQAIRPPRKLGVVCCPWCSERSVMLYKIVRDLAKIEGVENPKKERKRLIKLAKEIAG